MAGMINDLLDMLDRQAQSYEELYALSLEKKDAIIKDQIEELQKITNLENLLVTQIQRVEKKRLPLMDDISTVLGSDEKDLTLAKLADLMEGQEEQREIRKVSVRIREAIKKLSAANGLNGTLIRNALDYVEYSLNVMQSSVNQEIATYSVSGGKLKENDSVFDIKK